jgi:hypothetical protein
VEGLAVALAESAEPTDAPAEIEADPGEGDQPDAPFGGDILDPESVGGEGLDGEDLDGESDGDESGGDTGDGRGRFQDTESVGPEDSVRNPNDAGELGSFPESYNESAEEGDGGDELDDLAEDLVPEDEAESIETEGIESETGTESHDADDSFGDFEAAFDADDGDDERGDGDREEDAT